MTKDINQKQLLLLAAAEEAYSGAASILLPMLRNTKQEPDPILMDMGLHFLEEGMKAHNRYAASLK